MKRTTLLLVAALCFVPPAFAKKKKKHHPDAASVELTALSSMTLDSHGLLLDVSEENGDQQSHLNKRDSWDHQNTWVANTNRRDLSLQINVRNGGTTAQEATLEWFFVALQVGTGHKRIFNSGSKDLTVPASGNDVSEVTSSEVQNTHVSKNGVSFARGMTPTGWIVRLVQDGQVLSQKCSDLQLEDVTHDAAKVQKLQSPNGLEQ